MIPQVILCEMIEMGHEKINDLKPEILFTLEIVIERALWHAGGIEYFLNAGVIEPLEMDNLSARFQKFCFGVCFHSPGT